MLRAVDLLETPEFESFCDECEFNARMVHGDLELSAIAVEGSPCIYFDVNDTWTNFNDFLQDVQDKLDEMSSEINTLCDTVNEFSSYWEDNIPEYDDSDIDYDDE